VAVRRHLAAETVEDQRLGRLVEIDQDIAAEDDIEAAESGHFVEQVQLPETHHRANRRIDLPALALLLEILDEKLDGQAALHLELRVETSLGLVENLGLQGGGEAFDPPAGALRWLLAQIHGDR